MTSFLHRLWFRIYLWPRAQRAARSGLHRRWSEIATEFGPWNRSMFVSQITGPECVTLDQMCWPRGRK